MKIAILLACVLVAVYSAPLERFNSTALDEKSSDTEYCIHQENATAKNKKCYEACSSGTKFKDKGFTSVGRCSVHYNTVDSTKTASQCPDGVTNLKYCKGQTVNVTFTTKGEAGHCFHNEDAVDHKCYEACCYDDFKTKGFGTAGFCPDKYNLEEKHTSVRQCPDGVTNIKYCESTAVNVTIRTLGTKSNHLT